MRIDDVRGDPAVCVGVWEGVLSWVGVEGGGSVMRTCMT